MSPVPDLKVYVTRIITDIFDS